MNIRSSKLLTLLLLVCWPSFLCAEVLCDGVDDDIPTVNALSTFLSNTTGTLLVWFKPTGTASSAFPGSGNCYDGERIFADFTGGAGYTGLHRNGDLSSADVMCATHWTGTEQFVSTSYTNNAWTHLAWVHTGGNLIFYKDGTLVSSTSSGNTEALTSVVRACVGGEEFVSPAEGTVAAPHIFPTALSAQEIRVIADARTHNVHSSVPSGSWPLNDCAAGASGDGVTFVDRTGNGRNMTGNNGTNNTGLTCQGDTYVGHPWGVE